MSPFKAVRELKWGSSSVFSPPIGSSGKCRLRKAPILRPCPGNLRFRCFGSTPESRQNALQRLDSTRLVQRLEIQEDSQTIFFFADDPALAHQRVGLIENLIAANWLGKSLGLYGNLLLGHNHVSDERIGLMAHEDAAQFRVRLQSRRQIHFIADDGVVHPLRAADITDVAIARGDADAPLERS